MRSKSLLITVFVCSIMLFAAGCRRKQDPLPVLPPPVISDALSKESPVRIGMNIIQVRDILGMPDGTMHMGKLVVWRYDRGAVDFEDAVVSSSTILSDYDYAKKQALDEQRKILSQMAAERAAKRKESKLLSLLKKKYKAKGQGVANPAKEKCKEQLTSSVMGMLQDKNLMKTNSMVGALSEKMVGALVERELAKMPEEDRNRLFGQFEQSSDLISGFTNNISRAFQEME